MHYFPLALFKIYNILCLLCMIYLGLFKASLAHYTMIPLPVIGSD